jgi:hypothetical protein
MAIRRLSRATPKAGRGEVVTTLQSCYCSSAWRVSVGKRAENASRQVLNVAVLVVWLVAKNRLDEYTAHRSPGRVVLFFERKNHQKNSQVRDFLISLVSLLGGLVKLANHIHPQDRSAQNITIIIHQNVQHVTIIGNEQAAK